MTATTVVNLRDFPLVRGRRVLPDDVVRIDRPGPFGNRYKIGGDLTRDDAIALYRLDVETALAEAPSLMETFFGPLRGKRLACWCAPLPCHGDVIVELLARPRFLPQDMPALIAYAADYRRIRDRGDLA